MKTLTLAFAVIAGAVICAHAQQPPVTAFDGQYLGVSLSATGGGYGCKVNTNATPLPLIVQAGIAQFSGGTNGDWHFQGAVTADGHATLRDQYARICNVKIDPSGRAIGIMSPPGSACEFIRVWQKQ